MSTPHRPTYLGASPAFGENGSSAAGVAAEADGLTVRLGFFDAAVGSADPDAARSLGGVAWVAALAAAQRSNSQG